MVERKTKLPKWLAVCSMAAATLLVVSQPAVMALTPQQRRDYANTSIYFIDDPCPKAQAVSSVTSNDSYQDKNARTVIGVAKTYGLGQQGALIGLMTGLAESNLTNLANDGTWSSGEYLNTPLKQISESLPHDGIDNDHDSLGVMKQRPSLGWSTFGNGLTREVIGQLMTPAYAAQAFYGTPTGSQLQDGLANPGALKKGLQNLPGGWEVWQKKDPGEAAQAVQNTGFSAADYNEKKEMAQSLLGRLWDTSPKVALPITVKGGSFVSGEGCGALGQLNDLKDAIVTYAWPEYINPRCGTQCAILATTPKDAYAAAIKVAAAAGGYVGYNGIDCGGFVTRAMIDSKTDPGYNPRKGNTAGQIIYLREEAAKPDGKYIRLTQGSGTDGVTKGAGTVGLQFGDIAIRNGVNSDGSRYGHTFIFTGHFDYLDPATGDPKQWSENAASASGSGNVLSGGDRAPMAGKEAGDADIFEWYRLRKAPEATI